MRVTLAVALLAVVGGCSKASPATPRTQLAAVNLPPGYVAVAAVGTSLVLEQLGDPGSPQALVLYAGGKIVQPIAKRPWNQMFAFAADERWFVWVESEDDPNRSQMDRWSIWAWDSKTSQTAKIAQADGTAKELGISPKWQVGPRAKVSAGTVVWAAFDRAPSGKTVIQLHAYQLETHHNATLAATSPDDWSRFAYDIRGRKIVYRLGKQLVMVDGTEREVLATVDSPGEVFATQDAVLWAEGRRKLFMHTNAGVRELNPAKNDRWWFTSTDHYVTWYEIDNGKLHLLHTPDGAEQVLPLKVVQGAQVSGGFVFWSNVDNDGHPVGGMAATLPTG